MTGNVAADVASRARTAAVSEARGAGHRARRQVPPRPTASPTCQARARARRDDGTSSFKLAYRFVLADSQKFIRRYVDVDAASGAGAAVRPEACVQLCTSVDVTTLVAPGPLRR